MSQAKHKLSPHDQQVLDSIFNPLELSGIGAHNVQIEAEMELLDEEPQSPLLPASRELELEAVRLAERGELEQALLAFEKAQYMMERASILNNRAQALRLAKRDQGKDEGREKYKISNI